MTMEVIHIHIIRPMARSRDRKSTRLNSSHVSISYAVFCWKKKTRGTSEAGLLGDCAWASANRGAARGHGSAGFAGGGPRVGRRPDAVEPLLPACPAYSATL